MAKLRSILMPVAIILGILLPQAHIFSPTLPFLIGLMMFITFIGKVPPQEHGYTFKIEAKAFVASLVMLGILWGIVKIFHLPQEVLFGGAIICLCPPANAAPAMAKILGGNPVLALKIFLSGNLIACFSIPLIYGYLTGSEVGYLTMAHRIFNTIQPIISIPLAFALGIRSFYPELADKLSKFSKYTLLVWTISVFVILAKASYDIRPNFSEYWNSGTLPMLAIVALVLCIVQFVVGWFTGKKHPIESSQSMGQKNTTLVIWIASTCTGPIGPIVAIAPTCYVVWQNLVLSWMSRGKKKPK